uniref:Uncharacterized protein n=2 Tax=Eptatretus burgeri TaxID=7764 RepID=A0A8C4NF77_EPTBU
MLELLDASGSSRICKSAAATSEGSKRGGLPWWMVYLGWILVALTSAVSAFFTMLYGLTYGRKRSLEWLLSIGVSIFQSIFITQPLKVLGFAAFFALVLKRVDDEPEMTEPVEDALSGQLHLPGAGCQVARESLVYQPPSVQHVKDLKKKRQLEQRMYSLFREILAYVCFLWMLLLVVYGQRDPNAFHLNRAISRSLGSPGEEVLSHRAMYHWANSSLLSGLFGQNPGFLADGTSFLVGGVRLRQVRISNHSCKPPSSLVSEVPNCRAPYSWEKEDRRDYVGDGWLLPVSDNDTAALRDHSTEALTLDGESKLVGITTDGSWKNTAWQYRGSSKLRSYPVWGRFALYRGGGYALDLGTDKATAQRTLNYLHRTNWLDTQTRALFVEFTIYNANVNLFCVATLILENSGLGGFLSWMDLHSLRLYQNTAGLHIFVVTAEIIYFLFIIYYMVMQVKAIRAQGWCFLRGHWNLVDTALIVLSWTALAFFVQRTLYAQRDIALFRAQPDRFVSFYQAALSDAALGYLLSLIVLLATTKMWQLLRLNPKLSLLTGALRRAGQDMRSFLTLLSITLGAYAVSVRTTALCTTSPKHMIHLS